MIIKIATCCLVLLVVNTEALVKREVTPPHNNILEPVLRNMEAFKKCLDQALAQSVDEVNTKQLQPLFTVVGDQVNRVSKAFEDLTAPPKKTLDFK